MPKRVLFAGYAPVHFVCFLPVYRSLSRDPRIEIFLSGGFKQRNGKEVQYSLDGFYEPFGVEKSRVIPLQQARQEEFDVLVCSHLSDDFFPREVRKTVQIFHGVSFKNLAVREKALRFDMLCLPGRYHAELYQKNGFVRANGSLCLMTGFPKCDPLIDGTLDRATVLEGLGLDERLPTLLFAPTGEKHNALETAGETIVRAIGETRKFNLLVKPHDHPKNAIDWFERLKPLETEQVRLVRARDVIPFLHAADLLLTDASSVAVEYTLLDRPIIFVDVPRLFKKVRKRAPALDLETYGRRIGRIVENPEEIVRWIEDALVHPQPEAALRRAMAQHVFHRPGSATARVSACILYAAGLAPALPAEVEVLKPESPNTGNELRSAA